MLAPLPADAFNARFPAGPRAMHRTTNRLRGLAFALATLPALLVSGYAASVHHEHRLGGAYGRVQTEWPTGPVRGTAIVLAAEDGDSAPEHRLAAQLARRGMLVALVDGDRYLRTLRAMGARACPRLGEDAQHLGRRLARQAGAGDFSAPVLVARGPLSALARQVAAASAPDQVAAAVLAGPGTQAAPLPCPASGVAASGVTGSQAVPVRQVANGDDTAGWAAAVRAAIPASVASGFAGLPLVELPASGHGDGRMAVLLSGDGGWRELDQGIAQALQRQGVAVVGLNSLRYFWSGKDPARTAADLGRVIAEYRLRWHASRVALVGYSFGADVLPFVYPRLPPEQRAAVDEVALLGLAHEADFRIRMGGWLGLSGGGLPIAPQLAALPPQRLLCVYGTQERDTLCPTLRGRGVDVQATPGGHHFDHDPEAMAARILKAWPATAAHA